MSAGFVLASIALRLQHETDPSKAQALIDALADPWTRLLVRREWERARAAEVITLEAS